MTESDIDGEDTSDTHDDMDTDAEEVRGKNSKRLNSGDDNTDEDTDIEAAVFNYYLSGSDPHSSVSTIKGTHNIIRNGLSQHCIPAPELVSSSASTDNEMELVSSSNVIDGMPLTNILDNNWYQKCKVQCTLYIVTD